MKSATYSKHTVFLAIVMLCRDHTKIAVVRALNVREGVISTLRRLGETAFVSGCAGVAVFKLCKM